MGLTETRQVRQEYWTPYWIIVHNFPKERDMITIIGIQFMHVVIQSPQYFKYSSIFGHQLILPRFSDLVIPDFIT